MAPIGIGLIGLGRHGMRYARHLLEPLPNARLMAVCRRTAAQGSVFAAQHSVKFYQDYHDLIADSNVEAVVVVTPPSITRQICLDAVHARKPLLIEKPLAPTGVEAQEMVRAAASYGTPLMTAQTLRFESAILALKGELACVGTRQYLVLTNRIEPREELTQNPTDYAGRGVLLEIGIHLLDLVRFLTGEEVVEVWCDMDGSAPERPESRALISLWTSGGLPCIVDVSRVTAGRISRAEWVGKDGQLVADWVSHRLSRISSRNALDEKTLEDRPTIVATLQAFLDALERGAPMPITGLDGQRAVEIADACYQSAAIRQTVKV
ncbi:MAG TPA: Gfo/Idh/MocA family oxidoreductase [Nitrospiraceae bacterium]|nr:Gfo/Idh/MocA family oxidoreductase [Nitrospiraceae bacterium]